MDCFGLVLEAAEGYPDRVLNLTAVEPRESEEALAEVGKRLRELKESLPAVGKRLRETSAIREWIES